MAYRIAFASDHAALALKTLLIDHARALGHDVSDLGPHDETSVDSGAVDRGVALCGSGIGISIAVNRNPTVRCALVSEPLSARLCREHNDANAIAMGARLIGPDQAKSCLEVFLDTPFAGGRHQRRVGKLSAPAFDKEPAS
jgi:ribose 5-phosphate isomerase B